MHRKTIWILCLLISTLLGAPLAHSEPTRDPGQYFFQETFGNLQEELQLAREQGKQGILLFFEMDECPFCHRMKTQVLNQPKVQAFYREHFKIFPIDIEGDIELVDFQGRTTSQKDFAFKQFNVRATPVLAFFDLEGQLITRYTGATASADEFLWLGEFVSEGHYKQTNFNKFKREKRRQARH